MKSIRKFLYLSTLSAILISSCTTEDFKENNNINESEENNDGNKDENNNEDINNDETKTFKVFRISSSKDIALIENL